MACVYKSESTIEVNQAETIQLLSSLPSNSLSNLNPPYSFSILEDGYPRSNYLSFLIVLD